MKPETEIVVSSQELAVPQVTMVTHCPTGGPGVEGGGRNGSRKKQATCLDFLPPSS